METQAAAGGPPGALREALEALPGVRRVLIDGSPPRVLLVCDPPGGHPPVEAAAQALLRREGAPAAPLELQVSYLGAPRTRQRVRFLDLRCTRAASGQLSAVAVLEWNDRIHEGHAAGQGGPAGDLRVCAQATLQALGTVLDGAVGFHLVGVKSSRIFDDDMVAVLVYATDATDRRLVGTALVAEGDPCRAAALAVLNATNRTLGNYLSTTD